MRAELVYRTAAFAIRKLPTRVVLGGARAVGSALSRRRSATRAAVVANLARVLASHDVGELDEFVRRAYASYGQYWAETARLTPATDLSGAHFEIDGVEQLEAILNGKGAVLALPHLGTWEVGAIYMAQHGRPLTAVAEELKPRSLNDWFLREREALGVHVVTLDPSAISTLLGVLRRGNPIALIADRDITGNGVEVEFFGATTTLPGGPAILSLRAGVPLYPCAVFQQEHGGHRVIMRPAIVTERRGSFRADVARITQDLAHELERLISLAPEQWHVFQPNWPQ